MLPVECPSATAAGHLASGKDRIRRQVEAAAVAADARDLHPALFKDRVVGLMSPGLNLPRRGRQC